MISNKYFLFIATLVFLVYTLKSAEASSSDFDRSEFISWITKQEEMFPLNFGFTTSRAFMYMSQAAFDAVAAYQKKWVPGDPRSPKINAKLVGPKPNRQKNLDKAISFAIYRVLEGLLTPSQVLSEKNFFISLGYDPDDHSTNTNTPEGVGNTVAASILLIAAKDQTNSLGDEPTGNGTPFSDYTNFYPVNDPTPTVGKTDCTLIRNFNSLVPMLTTNGPQVWNPIFGSADTLMSVTLMDFLGQPPPLFGTATEQQFIDEHQIIIDAFAELDDFKKATAELWKRGSTLLLRILKDSASFEDLDLIETVKLFFMIM
jgi:hypothetical protein